MLVIFIFKELYKLGARRIAVFSAPPIGCVPAQRTIAGGVTRQCADNYNQAAVLFNSKLSPILNSFNSKLPNAKFVYVDVYNPILDLVQNPTKFGNTFFMCHFIYSHQNYSFVPKLKFTIFIFFLSIVGSGFTVSDKGCCGSGNLEVAVLCNQLTPITCPNVADHVFWDSYHPTESAYKSLIPPLLQKYVDQFF